MRIQNNCWWLLQYTLAISSFIDYVPHWSRLKISLLQCHRLSHFVVSSMPKDSSVDHLDFLIFLSATSMSERIKHNRDTMRLSYGAGVVTNFLGMVKLELNYCIPAWHQPHDKVRFSIWLIYLEYTLEFATFTIHFETESYKAPWPVRIYHGMITHFHAYMYFIHTWSLRSVAPTF